MLGYVWKMDTSNGATNRNPPINTTAHLPGFLAPNLQTVRQSEALQILIERMSEMQLLEATGQSHLLHASVEPRDMVQQEVPR